MTTLRLDTNWGRYYARKLGFDVPKRRRGMKPKDFDSLLRRESNGCLVFTGRSTWGYGYYCNGGNHRAHRWAWERVNGSIPDGLVVMHLCDNKLCCNLEHLRLGTQAENIADKVSKHRQARGERMAEAKLTREIVKEARRLCVPGKRGGVYTYTALARRFGVDRAALTRAVKGQTWRDETSGA